MALMDLAPSLAMRVKLLITERNLSGTISIDRLEVMGLTMFINALRMKNEIETALTLGGKAIISKNGIELS